MTLSDLPADAARCRNLPGSRLGERPRGTTAAYSPTRRLTRVGRLSTRRGPATCAVTELVRVLVERNELQAAEDTLDQLVDPSMSRSIEVPRLLFALGQLRRAQDRLQEALDDFLACGVRYERFGSLEA